jgi:predicted DNA-binding transcriptional regulator YafY
VPIHGEAGVGYVLDSDFDMPPLMLTADELEAAVLGAQWVADWGDAVLARAARDQVSKITSVVPERLRPSIAEPSIGVPTSQPLAADGLDIALTRSWIRSGRKIRIRHRDEQSRETERTIWPTIIGYAETVRLLAAWCELRKGFRHFGTDRIFAAEFLQEPYGCHARELRARWRRFVKSERGICLT